MSPIGRVAERLARPFLAQVWEDVLGYLRLYDYLKQKGREAFGRGTDVTSLEQFWYSILGDKFSRKKPSQYLRLRDGEIVRFRDVFLSEWAPKLPGRIWTAEGTAQYRRGLGQRGRRIAVADTVYLSALDPYGKRAVVSAGFGSVRIRPRRAENDAHALVCLVDRADWHADRGIPVVLSRPAYRRFKEYSEAGAPWAESLEAELRLDEPLPFQEVIPPALGARLSPETEDTLRNRPGLRRCYLYVSSPLAMRLRHNDSAPDAAAWSMFETRDPAEPYRYTYATFNAAIPESTEDAVEFIKAYAHEYDGRRFVTDFDAITPRLDAEIPVLVEPTRARREAVQRLIRGVDRWGRRWLRR